MDEPRTLEEWTRRIRDDVATHRVFIYSKGDRDTETGTEALRVMALLDRLGVDYGIRNIFADPMIRPAVCAYSQWPTIPQVFLDGEFIGGWDLLTAMYESGELQRRLAAPESPRH